MTRKPCWPPIYSRVSRASHILAALPPRAGRGTIDSWPIDHAVVAQAFCSSAATTMLHANRPRCSMQCNAMRCDAMRWHITWAWSRGRLTTTVRLARLVSLLAAACRALFFCSLAAVATVAHAAFVHCTYDLAPSLRHRQSGASSQWIAIRPARATSQRSTRALFPALGAGFGFLCFALPTFAFLPRSMPVS